MTKRAAIGQFYSRPVPRILIIACFLFFLFQRIDVLFYFVFIMNIPHLFISSMRKLKAENNHKKSLLISDLMAMFIGIILAVYYPKFLFYVVFIRFVLHFFEDKFFNIEYANIFLSTLVIILYLSTEFYQIPVSLRLIVSALGLITFYILKVRKNTYQVLNFYPVFMLLIFVPWLLRMNVNSFHWGFGIGMLHTLLWLTWDGFVKEKDYQFSWLEMIRSSSFLITIGFSIAVSLYFYTQKWDYQYFLKNFMLLFYVCLFTHIFSADLFKIFLRFKGSKNL